MQRLTPQKVILPVQQPHVEEGYFDALIGNVLGGKKSKIYLVLQTFFIFSIILAITTLSCTKSKWHNA